ncbi:phosphate ABC transporter substrate-binding protein PstS [Mycobacterium sp. ACS4054]|uniref:phosphate ABC transporter substrate-binding protein PstS n=1 Tax=Mycobacterium sp. ACS4054 TaxID=1834119 RepID=UPI0008019897|nr:phosphate ABC transporter substrate-binding protein PstS [Mycobacterium sp. ACS4054]OBF04136.1 phosphate ABC transporter substrate-binding protein PstS [Mycobacterium sp. ACS4054]
MRLKRFRAALGVATVVALAVAGCGSNENGAGDRGGPGTSTSKVSCGGAKSLKASGSTAQANAMTRFIKAFEQACPGQTLNYTPNGSGAGIGEFTGDQTDFAGSDSPLASIEYFAARQRCGSPAWNLPVVFGPIAIAFHVAGVASLNLDGPTAARVFKGAVTAWNDPAIAALNPGVAFPAEPIRVIFRNDQSGTTDNFQKYLDSAANGVWDKGIGKTFNGGVGEGVRGNDGASAAVKATEGSITYVEWSFAQAQKLDMAKVVTSAGPDAVAISADSVGKTIAGADFSEDGNDLVVDTFSFYKPTQPGSYPIVLATYEIVCSKYPDPQVAAAVKAFLQSTVGAGQDGLTNNGYVPVPQSFKSRLSAAIDAIS